MRLSPRHWYSYKNPIAWLLIALLWPVSLLYGLGHRLHQKTGKPYHPPQPVICIGNLVVGGTGKTPTALAVMKLVRDEKLADSPFFLSRGYGGALHGPVRVDRDHHDAAAVGDEALLLHSRGPVVIARDRAAGAKLAGRLGADLLIMDDGMHNPGLDKTLKLVVIDGPAGFGNRMMLPAGPLRTPLRRGIKEADGFILIGEDLKHTARKYLTGRPVFRATLEIPDSWIADDTAPYVAFSGIGRPDKFRESLIKRGLDIAAFRAFPDHHVYSEQDLSALAALAKAHGARLATTEKDAVKIPAPFKKHHKFDTVPVTLIWHDQDDTRLAALIREKIRGSAV